MSSVVPDRLDPEPALDLGELTGLVTPAFLRENLILPVSLTPSLLKVAMVPPPDRELVQALELAAERRVEVAESDAKAVQSGLEALFSSTASRWTFRTRMSTG
jgi:hypothetical protein